MRIIRHDNWVRGESYRKRILIDKLKDHISLIQDVVVEPHGEIPSHSHDFTDEIFYVTSGKASVVLENNEEDVVAGDMVIIDKKEKHGYKNDNDEPFNMIVFKLNFKKGDSYLK